ncbi:hypothetical protein pb186bvf_010669 [Paramecium bursaria]
MLQLSPKVIRHEIDVQQQITFTYHLKKQMTIKARQEVEEPFRLEALQLERKYVDLQLQIQHMKSPGKFERRSTFYRSPEQYIQSLRDEIVRLKLKLSDLDLEILLSKQQIYQTLSKRDEALSKEKELELIQQKFEDLSRKVNLKQFDKETAKAELEQLQK